MVSTCFQITKLKVRLLIWILPNRTGSASDQLTRSCLSHTLLVKQHLFHLRARGLSLPSWQGQGHQEQAALGAAAMVWSDPSTEAGHVSSTSLAGGSARTKNTPLVDAPVLRVESSAASTLHAGFRCLCSSAQSLLNLDLH